MMTDAEKENLVQRFIEAYNNFDVDKMLACLDAQVNFRNISNGELTLELNGLEDFGKQAATAAALFSARRQTIEEMIVTGETCEVSIDYEGTLAADLSDELKAGERIKLKGKSIYEFKGDKISRIEDLS